MYVVAGSPLTTFQKTQDKSVYLMVTLLLIEAAEPIELTLTLLPMPPEMLPPSILPTLAMLPLLLEVTLDALTLLPTEEETPPLAIVVLEAEAEEPTALTPILPEILPPPMPGAAPSVPPIDALLLISPVLLEVIATPEC